MGVLRGFAGFMAPTVVSLFDFYADLASSFAFEERHVLHTGPGVGLLVREPVGVVGAIIPWNAPAALIAQKLAPALLARSEERRVGKEGVRTCRYRGSPYH